MTEKDSPLGCSGTLGLISMVLLGACLLTDMTLSRIYKGGGFAIRMMFPFSFVERDLDGQRRYEHRCLEHTTRVLRDFFNDFQYKNEAALARRDIAYKPLMVLPDETHRSEEQRSSGGYEQMALRDSICVKSRFTTEDPFISVRYPYVDWNAVPLVQVKSRNDLTRFFPHLLDGLRSLRNDRQGKPSPEELLGQFPMLTVPGGELVPISLAYAYDALGAKENGRNAQMNATAILFPLLILVFAGLCSFRFDFVKMLPLRLFAAVYPIALFMEVTQPMCYSPARGRLIEGNRPDIQNACSRVITELAKDGTLDAETRKLLEQALERPDSLFKK